MAAVVQAVDVGVSLALGHPRGWLEPSTPALFVIALVWSVVLAGGLVRWLDVRGGGQVLARRFGATPVAADDGDRRVRRLVTLVSETARVANCPPMDVHVLRPETGINGFVVGASARPSLVVSQGALDTLSCDELRGIVAHEIAHVVQGDLALNMRVLIVLGALSALDGTGRRLNDRARVASVLGWPLRVLGSIGLFAASVIRAIVSRRREFLADAAAVELTGQPFALASALATIRETKESGVLHSPHAATLAHLCIHVDARPQWGSGVLASHPPLPRRIHVLDPHTDVKRRKLASASARRAALDPDVDPRAGADVGKSGIPDRILLLLPHDADCLATLCALFASTDPIVRRDYIDALRFAFDDRLADRVAEVLPMLAAELETDRLGLVEHACGVLRERVRDGNRSRFLLQLERLLASRGELDLAGYATLQLVRRKLDCEFPLVERVVPTNDDQARSDKTDRVVVSLAERRRVKTADTMGEEFALLLSLMVEASGAPDAVREREFARILASYTRASPPRRVQVGQGTVAELERAFQTLYVQPKPIRRAFVRHCIEIMQADGHVARAERSLLDLFAASLGCEELAA